MDALPTPAADDADETVTDVLAADDEGLQARLWLRAIVPVLQLRAPETEAPQPTGRLEFALDRMYIAACERAARILRSDLSVDDTDVS